MWYSEIARAKGIPETWCETVCKQILCVSTKSTKATMDHSHSEPPERISNPEQDLECRLNHISGIYSWLFRLKSNESHSIINTWVHCQQELTFDRHLRMHTYLYMSQIWKLNLIFGQHYRKHHSKRPACLPCRGQGVKIHQGYTCLETKKAVMLISSPLSCNIQIWMSPEAIFHHHHYYNVLWCKEQAGGQQAIEFRPVSKIWVVQRSNFILANTGFSCQSLFCHHQALFCQTKFIPAVHPLYIIISFN